MEVTIEGKKFNSDGKRVVIIRNLDGKLADVTEENYVAQAGATGLNFYRMHDAGWEFVRFGEIGETAEPDQVSEARNIPGIITQPIVPPVDMAQAMTTGKRGPGRPKG